MGNGNGTLADGEYLLMETCYGKTRKNLRICGAHHLRRSQGPSLSTENVSASKRVDVLLLTGVY